MRRLVSVLSAALVGWSGPWVQGAVDHFTWATIVSPKRPGVAFAVTVTAQDAAGNTATDFNGTATLSARRQGSEQVVFNDNFEDGNLNGWVLAGAAHTAAVVTSPVARGLRSLALTGGTQHHFDGLSSALANVTPDRLEFYARASATNKNGGYFVVGTGTNSVNLALMFRFDTTATMGLFENGVWHGTPYVANRWYKIGFVLNWAAKNTDFYVDDRLVEAAIPFRSSTVERLSAVYLYNYHSTRVWYDEFSFTSSGAVTLVTVLPGATEPFVNGVWNGAVAIPEEAANVTLRVDDGSGHVGVSNPFNVEFPPPTLDHFTWATIGSPQRAGVGFPVTLSARDAIGRLVTSFYGTVQLSGEASPGRTVFMADDFEDGDYSGWTSGTGAYTRTVTTNTAAHGTHSFSLTGGSQRHYDGVSRALADLRPDRVDFSVRASDATKNGGYCVIGTGPDSTTAAIFFFLRSDGTMGITENYNWHYEFYQANEWYRITFRLNWTLKTVDFYVDDRLIEPGIPFRAPLLEKVSVVYLYNGDSTQVWWDDIQVLNEGPITPAPVTPTLSGGFNAGVWQGQLVVNTVASNVVLRADDGGGRIGHVGLSQPLTVQSWPPRLDHYAWSPVASPQRAGAPFTITVAARDAAGVTVSNFTGMVGLTAYPGPEGLAEYFGEDFEAGNLSGWSAGGGNYAAGITTTTAAEGTRSLSLSGGNQTHFDGLAHPLPDLRPARIEFYARAAAADKDAGSLVVGTGPSLAQAATLFHFDNRGNMAVGGSGVAYATPAETNRWYHVSLRLDWSVKRVHFYVDDRLVRSSIPFRSATVDRLSAVYLYNLEPAQVWWDDLRFLQEAGTPCELNPTVIGPFVNGAWSGNLTANTISGHLKLVADDGNHFGSSALFAFHAGRLDGDADGLPDGWELAYGLDPRNPADAALDTDGDGLTNLQEYAAGTHPRDPASAVKLMPLVIQGGHVTLSSKTGVGRQYQLQYRPTVPGIAWSNLTTVNGAGGLVTFTETNGAANPTRFYRVKVLP